jgi:SAM-dependent methyltransferase
MNQPEQLREGVRAAYSDAARRPADKHPFPLGRGFAESLGYSAKLLESIPAVAVEAFAGVSNVSLFAEIPTGSSVLDLGCGAGLDSLIAAHRVGPNGKVMGVDFSEAMLDRARFAAREVGATNVAFVKGDAERLPVETAAFHFALANGIFNLNPAREAIFHELARVLKPGGSAYVAELILREPLPHDIRASEANWFA